VLSKIRRKLEFGQSNPTHTYFGYPEAGTDNEGMIELVDRITYWVFLSGIYKDHRKEVQNYFYFPMFAIMFAMAIERQAINWLTNRNGCTYNKL